MTDPVNEFNSLEASIWRELDSALTDRHHGWRKPILATIDVNGVPQARTVILRQVDREQACLAFFTDRRSPKVEQLREYGIGTLVFWSEQLGWQLRVTGPTHVAVEGKEVEAAWEQLKLTAAAADYLSMNAPGSLLVSSAEPAQVEHNLAIITVKADRLDWLELNRKGHRRALRERGVWQWVIP